jgi:SHS2 domain-containing protein
MAPYEIVEHTADIGIRASGRSREELFAQMAEGVFSLIVPPEEVRPAEMVPVKAEAGGWEDLLVAWLKELLYLFDTRHFLVKSVKVLRLEEGWIEAEVSGEKLDPARHSAGKEVKAVTYCGLSLKEEPGGGWSARVILDI